MNLAIVAAVFPVIFIGELPDKTMFASLVMASRGRPRAVWLGAAGAFLVHAVIATTIGAGLFAILPREVVDVVVALMFFAGAVYAYVDLTQILTANLAAHYHSPLSVAVGAVAALWLVAALAVTSGQTLLRFFPLSTVRRVTALVLFALGVISLWAAVR